VKQNALATRRSSPVTHHRMAAVTSQAG